VRAHVAGQAGKARSDHVIGPTLDDRGHQVRQLLGGVLAVGIEEGDGGDPPFGPPRQAGAHGSAQAQVPVERVNGGAGSQRRGRGPVGGTVVDDHDLDRVPVHLGRRPPHEIADGQFLVVGRQDHDHWAGGEL
jgi:hypothetical protein